MSNVSYRSHRTLRLGLSALLVAALSACEPEPRLELHGTLFFDAGPYLGKISLSSGDVLPVTSFGDERIEHVSRFDNGDLLLSIARHVETRPRDRLVRFNPRTLDDTPLVAAQAGHYLEASNTVVYYRGAQLMHAPLTQLRGGGRVIETFTWRDPPHIVAVGDFGVLFAGADGAIQRYDPSSDSTERLDALSTICSLQDAVWLADREQLLCRTAGTADGVSTLILADLDGRRGEALALPEGRRFRPVAYLYGQRVLVLSESRRGRASRHTVYPVWAYALDSGRLQRIADNQYLGESAVYRQR